MVAQVTPELIYAVASSGQQRPYKNETKTAYLARQTHLHFNGKGLKSSAMPVGVCPNVKTLYLFDNKLESIEGLGSLSKLSHLYCQDNKISAVVDIAGLTSLKKIYLNGNCLPSLAPLAPLVNLEELHASSQRIDPEETFDVAGQVLASLRLRVLDLSNNGLETTDELVGCRWLETAILAKNKLNSLASVVPLLSAAPLVELDVRGNSVSNSRQSMDSIVVACPTVSVLNGRTLTASERPYLQQLHRLGRRRIDLSPDAPRG